VDPVFGIGADRDLRLPGDRGSGRIRAFHGQWIGNILISEIFQTGFKINKLLPNENLFHWAVFSIIAGK
jgi:hypothetical protein